ncbi:Sphingomyelin phosphodiesterase [Orchesella cincta]|uniref:Sphingomyelin phosphodiesterase n=1 Tax=Orchesella cincta TaxID=48709 RepID=A0A1D2MI95_ORCCI|nr:Sphingomyelin phosphodiesterase [Orchesella cincta]
MNFAVYAVSALVLAFAQPGELTPLGENLKPTEFETLAHVMADASNYMDQVLANLRDQLHINGFNSVALPDQEVGFKQTIGGVEWHGEAKLYNGSLKNMDTIHRTGAADITILPDGDIVIAADAGVNYGELDYDMSVEFMDLGPHVAVKGKLSKVRVLIQLRVTSSLNVTMEKFDIKDTGLLTVDIKGLGAILNFLVEIIAVFLGNLIKGIVAWLLEGVIKDLINDIISGILFPPSAFAAITSVLLEKNADFQKFLGVVRLQFQTRPTVMFKLILFALLLAPPVVFTEPHNLFIDALRPFSDDIRSWISTIGRDGSVDNVEIQADYFGCDLCSILIPLVDLALQRYSTGQIQQMVITACKILDLAPQPEVCEPIIKSYTDQFLYILGPTNPHAKYICGIINSNCGDVDADLEDWRIIVDKNKPQVLSKPRIPDEVDTVKILQFTDIHLDPDYKEGTTTECGSGMPICCREEYGYNDTVRAAGKYGDFNCALPNTALDAMYNHSKTVHADAKYIFLTGDYVHSGVWLYSKVENSRAIKYATEKLVAEFADSDAKIYPLTGNHEPHVINLYPPNDLWSRNESGVINDDFSLEWLYKLVLDPFIKRDSNLLPKEEQENFLSFGYYSVSPEPGLRLLAINTNLCYDQNFWLAFYPQDPNGQLQWLADELLKAETNEESVIIIGHVQPEGCWPVWSDKFHAIINRFEGIIRAQFYGHSHRPQHRVTFEKGTTRGSSVSFIAGSALTDGMNPGYAVYYFDGVRDGRTWDPVRQELVILKLDESNEKEQAVFETITDTKEHFGLKDLRPESVYDMAKRMICDQQLLDNYLEFYSKGEDSRSHYGCSIQNNTCKASIICNIVSSDSSDPAPCTEIKRTIEATQCRNGRGQSSSDHIISNISLLAMSFLFFCLVFKH